jgi:large subunit ribosomal protein L15
MLTLHNLINTCRDKKVSKRLGRGPGSKLGKTCGRGQKGMGARAGVKWRHGYEGGQFRLFMKLPIRGFNNANYKKQFTTVNLYQIEEMYEAGEIVNGQTLKERGFITNEHLPVKVLANGILTKKVVIDVACASHAAREKLSLAHIELKTKM